jgi:RNA polymerase sigma-70 factor (ECF subfamily)
MPKALSNKNLQVRMVRTAKKAGAEARRSKNLLKAATSATAEVYLSPTTVPFYLFDEDYLKRLQEEDPEAGEHFCAYFNRLLLATLQKRCFSYHDAQDITNETIRTAWGKVRAGEVRDATRLGAFVYGICRNVMREHRRRDKSHETIHQDGFDVPGTAPSPLQVMETSEKVSRVRQVLANMPERDRKILIALFIEERDRDEICREHDVDREYLRVLVHRAAKVFKELFLKQ